MVNTSAVYDLFEKLAKAHPIIGHNPNGGVNRFFGFNFDESESENFESATYPRIVLSKSSNPKLNIKYKYIGHSGQKMYSFTVTFLKNTQADNHVEQKDAYAEMEQVMDDFLTWMFSHESQNNQCDFEVIETFDQESITAEAIGPIGKNSAYGWALNITTKTYVEYSSSNPLHSTMIP